MKLTPPFRSRRSAVGRLRRYTTETGKGIQAFQSVTPALQLTEDFRQAAESFDSRGMLLAVLRVLGAALMLGLLWLFLTPRNLPFTVSSLSPLALWAIAASLGWLLARQRAHPLFFDAGRQIVFEPFWTLLISAALFVAVGRFSSLLVLLPLNLLWLGYLLAWNTLARQISPPLRVGVTWLAEGRPDELSPLISDSRVRYVPLAEQPGLLLSSADVVLTHPQVSRFSEHQRVVQHAQVAKIPIVSKQLLDEQLTGKVALDQLNRDWLDALAFQSRYALFKRVLDVAATLLLLPVLIPLSLVVALVVRINSGTPVLFWQERVGKDGKTFNIAKFRSMTTDSERSGPAFASQGDQRITPVGGFLRKFRLDELPQFWNVLRGEMSIIGPRPEQWAFAADFEESIPLYACRHWVRPGITGWAQVNQGYTDNMGQTVEKLQYDFYYVKHSSLALDLVIVGKTIRTVLNGFGAR